MGAKVGLLAEDEGTALDALKGGITTTKQAQTVLQIVEGEGDPQAFIQSMARLQQKRDNIKEYGRNEKVFDTSVPLVDRIFEHLTNRMLFSNDLAPMLTASIGGHLADLQQAPTVQDECIGIEGGKDLPFYFYKGDPEPMAIPIAIIMPPGLSKSWAMKKYFDRRSGICPLRAKFQGTLTEAGYVAKEGKAGEIIWGDAYNYRNGFLLFNEISNIFIASETTHSGGLKNQVMESLSEREVGKRVGGMDVRYDTYLTMWGGIQNIRFNFSEGLGRRFEYLTRAWTVEDINSLKVDRLEEKLSGNSKIRVNMDEVRHIRDSIAKVFKDGAVEDVKWEPALLRRLNEQSATHTESSMHEKVIIGLAYLNQTPGEKVLKINDCKTYASCLTTILKSKDMVSAGGNFSLIVSAMSDRCLTYEEAWKLFNRGFHYSLTQFVELWQEAKKIQLIKSKIDDEKGTVYYVAKGMK